MASRQYTSRPYRVKDLSGQRFGNLMAIEVAGRDKQGRAVWFCVCDCGNSKVIPSRHLGNGVVRSCGCIMRASAARNGKRGADKIRGDKCHLYKPHLTEEDRLDRRNCPKLRDWRKAVFARDDYTCQLCSRRGVSLAAHHLYSWAEHPNLRLDITNGITLCKLDHKRFHAFMGGEIYPCTPIDYERFKARWYLDREIQRIDDNGESDGEKSRGGEA